MNNTIPNNSTENQAVTGEPNEDSTVSTALNSLSPISDADKDGHYSKMLLWALQNRKEKDIKNIALTGPYGSGKSSILKTFENKYQSDDLLFLNISLATFKEENGAPASKIRPKKQGKDIGEEKKDEDDNTKSESASPAEKQALLRLVELSILQQIFYHEKDDDIPDTRFKKTRSFSEESAAELTVNIFLFLISLAYLLYSETIWKLFDIDVPQSGRNLFNVLALGTVIWMSYHFIRKSIRPLRSVQLKKFNVQQAEFAVDENISKSILNEYLDEILYFFEVTKYTVVVFEDLDRFEQTEIFTKLRELNHLINYSKKMNERRVVFVYAVRDEMFQDKDRTKFFDFIIPVIPVINSSNSNEILLGIVKQNKYKINTDLIDNVSFFVDDMRLLFNIMNEYHLYRQKLNVKDQNKLLAVIVYKNMYPNDFVGISNGEGELFGILNNKSAYIARATTELDQQITELKDEITILESVAIKDADEIRKLYILQYLTHYPDAVRFRINGGDYSFTQAVEEDVFQYFINNNVKYIYMSSPTEYADSITVSFKTIESEVDPNLNYAQRLELIESLADDKLDSIKETIAELEHKKNIMRHQTIKEIMVKDVFKLDMENHKQKQLISILLRGGYIDENYLDYVSIFYEGSITKADKEFLLNVRAHIKTEFDYTLSKIDKLIGKITDTEFEQEYVLNYSLMDYLFKSGYGKQRSKIFSTLANENDSSIEFIEGYLDQNSANLGSFIAQLVKVWPGIWNYLTTKSVFTQDRVEHYFNLIIAHADVKDIEKIATSSNLRSYIATKEDFLQTVADEGKLEKVIKDSKVRFNSVNLKDAPIEKANFVVDGNYYKLNETMAERVLRFKDAFSEKEYNIKNYTYIKTTAPKEFVEYVDKNLDEYIENIWLPLADAIDNLEDEKYLLELLNNDTIDNDNKIAVIEKVHTKITDLKTVGSHDIDQELLKANKAVASWENLVHYLDENSDEFDDILISFVSDDGNAQELKKKKLNTSESNKETAEKIASAVISQQEIQDDAYAEILDGIPYQYNNLNFVDGLSIEKVRILVTKGKFGVTVENFDRLKAKTNDLHILLLERDPGKVVSDLAPFNIDENDALFILNSLKFSTAQKNTVVNHLPLETIKANTTLVVKIGTLITSVKDFAVAHEVLTYILSVVKVEIALAALNKHFNDFSTGEIEEFISSWPNPYNEIITKGKRPWLSGGPVHTAFVQNLLKAQMISKFKDEKDGIRISTFRK